MEESLLRAQTIKLGVIIVRKKRYDVYIVFLQVLMWISFSFFKLTLCWEQLDALMGSLNSKGEREKALLKQLEKFYSRIWLVCFKRETFLLILTIVLNLHPYDKTF